MGWGRERDEIIKKCKIIINVHHFECFKIFEHIRCDRLIFANKIIISESSIFHDKLDIYDHVIWTPFENIITKTQFILDNFDTFNVKHDTLQIINDRKLLK